MQSLFRMLPGLKPTPSLLGYVDLISDREVSGWVHDPTQPDEPLFVDITVNEERVARVKAFSFREDLLTLGYGDGRKGFAFVPTGYLRSGENHVRVSYADTEKIVPNGDQVVLNVAGLNAEAHAEGDRRVDYKSVWGALSQTLKDATIHVTGADVPDNELLGSATQTRQWLEETVHITSDDVVLEIGCGIGRVGQVLTPICKRWIGCDVSLNMLEHTRKRLAAYSNVELIEISGFDLRPIRDASVDVVYCTVVFMHLDEWDRYNYVTEAHRVLRPGGRFFVDNFSLCNDDGWKVFDTHRQIPPAQRPPHISKSSTPQEIEVYLRRAGFGDVRIRERGFWVQGYAIK
jgi:SAM-dependent methyltransferase